MPLKIVLGRIVFGLLFGAAGLTMARLAVLAILRRREWKKDGVVVEGEIVGFEERADSDRSDLRPLFAPVVSFVRTDGGAGHFTSGTAVRPNPYVVGQKIPVRYLRSSPLEADLDSATKSPMAIAVLITLAIVCLGIAILPIVMPAPSTSADTPPPATQTSSLPPVGRLFALRAAGSSGLVNVAHVAADRGISLRDRRGSPGCGLDQTADPSLRSGSWHVEVCLSAFF